LVTTALIVVAVGMSIDVTIHNYGKITLVGLDAYGGGINSGNGAFSVDWGKIYVGGSKNISFNLRSVSNVPVTLAFSISDWNPESIEPFIQISWDYSGNQISPGGEIPIRINITPSTSTDFVNYLVTNQVTSFSFSLNIHALES
jgi:hypothetical protein